MNESKTTENVTRSSTPARGSQDGEPLRWHGGGIAAALVVSSLFSRCGKAYNELETRFAVTEPSSSPTTPVKKVMFVSTKEVGIASYEDVYRVRLTPEFVELEPSFPKVRMETVRIPTGEVEACSKTCFDPGTWDADLLVPSAGVEVSFRNAPQIFEWCWANRVPMVNSELRRAWLYKSTPLPGRADLNEQLASRERFDYQAKLACQGR